MLGHRATRAHDSFLLTNGGQVEGTLVNTTENPRTKYVIKTNSGGEITLDRNQVAEMHRTKPAELNYIKLRPQYPDTVEGQWALAELCRTTQLQEERVRHLDVLLSSIPTTTKLD